MTQNTFNFDEDIDRRAVPALKVHPNVLGQDGADLFPGGVADMDFKPPPAVLSAMRDRVAHGVFGYEAVPYGLLPALTGWFQDRHGWTVDPSHILRAPNVLNILAMAARVFTKEGDGVIVQPPVFFDFYDIIAENNRRLVANPLLLRNGRYEMDFAGLARVAADPNVTMLYLCNPHNPVGRVWMPAELLQLGAICRAHGVLVVSDEIHGDVTFPGHHYTPFATLSDEDARNSIICISPAKSFNIAACCAAFSIVIDANRRAMLQAENSRLTVNKNNAFSNVAMEAAYLHGEPWLDAALAYGVVFARTARRDDRDHEDADRLDSPDNRCSPTDARQDPRRDAGLRRLTELQRRESAAHPGSMDAAIDDPKSIFDTESVFGI